MMNAFKRFHNENGSALLAALLVTILLTTLGASLAFMIVSEAMISGNYRSAQDALYAADAGLERSMADLRGVNDWSVVLAGIAASSFDDGAFFPLMPDGTALDLGQRTAVLQAQSDARYGGVAANPNTPGWRLFAHAPVSSLLPSGAITARTYVAVWIADDPADGDGDRLRDANGVVMLRAESYGTAGARRIVEATVGRPSSSGAAGPPVGSGGIHLISWRQIR
jgi:hypothetical protein